jgi:hypothetical protein
LALVPAMDKELDPADETVFDHRIAAGFAFHVIIFSLTTPFFRITGRLRYNAST